jgi:Flagellar biosynthesis/type III secretory pathway lipoprotein
MPSAFAAAFERIRDFWSGISLTQRMFIGGLSVVLTAAFIFMLIWLSRPEFNTLYANLTPEDANRVLKALEAQQVPYKIEQNGAAILVPSDKVHELRITMAGEKLLTGQGVGFEIFDETQIGRTDFVQKLTYRRALEGELARTISEFPGVETARVPLDALTPHAAKLAPLLAQWHRAGLTLDDSTCLRLTNEGRFWASNILQSLDELIQALNTPRIAAETQ